MISSQLPVTNDCIILMDRVQFNNPSTRIIIALYAGLDYDLLVPIG